MSLPALSEESELTRMGMSIEPSPSNPSATLLRAPSHLRLLKGVLLVEAVCAASVFLRDDSSAGINSRHGGDV